MQADPPVWIPVSNKQRKLEFWLFRSIIFILGLVPSEFRLIRQSGQATVVKRFVKESAEKVIS